MKDTKIQWHPAFAAAMELEFARDKDTLAFHREYNLNTKPLEIDLLVIRRKPAAAVSNDIGRIFRGHNIIEYKSPNDRLDIDILYKTTGYACLYKAYGETVNARSADDITVSLIRDRKPEALFKYFQSCGHSFFCPSSGIYYADGNLPFPTQIIVTKELEREAHTWLRALSTNVQSWDAQQLLSRTSRLEGKYEQEMADSVLSVMLQANNQIAKKWKGAGNMYMPKTAKVLREIFAPELENERKEGMKEGMKEGIQGTVDILRDFGRNNSSIKVIIMEKFGLSSDEAEEYF